MRKPLPYLLAVAVMTMPGMQPRPAQAQHHDDDVHGSHGHAFHGSDFHGRDFHSFTPFERRAWTGGHWVNGWHDNHFA